MMNKTVPKTSELQAVAENFNDASVVSPNDGTVVAYDSLWIGGAGNVTVDMAGGKTNVPFNSVPAGTLLRIAVTKVYATGTTAANIVGLNY